MESKSSINTTESNKNSMTYFELFAGIGGFGYGIEKGLICSNRGTDGGGKGDTPFNQRSGFQSSQGKTVDYPDRPTNEQPNVNPNERTSNCVGYSEIDKYASAIYQKHWPEVKNYGDITAINPVKLPDFDLLTFGSPCQDFSIAGKRAGLRGQRSSLIGRAIEIIWVKRPGIFIWENVRGAFSSNDGADFWAIIKAFTDIGGYRLEWQLLNTEWFLPQNRERIYLIGHLRGFSRPKVFPIGENAKGAAKRPKQASVNTLSAGGHSGGMHSSMTIISRPHGFNKGGEKELPCVRGSSFEQNDFLMGNNQIRRLTPIECERLQGFPDNWTKYDNNGNEISDTQRYKCLGNAVSVPVVEEIIRRSCRYD